MAQYSIDIGTPKFIRATMEGDKCVFIEILITIKGRD